MPTPDALRPSLILSLAALALGVACGPADYDVSGASWATESERAPAPAPEPEAVHVPEPTLMEVTCARTVCDDKRERCEIRSSCFSRCVRNGVDASSCGRSCSGTCETCVRDDATTCTRLGFNMRIPEPTDQSYIAVCEASFDLWAECAPEQIVGYGPADCPHWSRSFTEASARSDACFGEAACTGDASACSPGDSDLGDRFCGAHERGCGVACSGEWRGYLNLLGGRLDPEVARATQTCSDQALSCYDQRACLNVWISAVLGRDIELVY